MLKPTTAYIPVEPESVDIKANLDWPMIKGNKVNQFFNFDIKNLSDWKVLDRRENVYVLTKKEYEAMWEDIEHRVKMRLADGSDMRHTFWKNLRYDVEQKLGK
jgi:hypothetical protein